MNIFDPALLPGLTVDPSAPTLAVEDGCFVLRYGSEVHRLPQAESRRLAQRLLFAQRAPRKSEQTPPKKPAGYCEERHGKSAMARCRRRAEHRGKHRSRDGVEW